MIHTHHQAGTFKATEKRLIVLELTAKMSLYYTTDDTVRAVTNAIQDKFETYTHRRKNFGPYFKKKLVVVKAIAGHGDHIHLSIN